LSGTSEAVALVNYFWKADPYVGRKTSNPGNTVAGNLKHLANVPMSTVELSRCTPLVRLMLGGELEADQLSDQESGRAEQILRDFINLRAQESVAKIAAIKERRVPQPWQFGLVPGAGELLGAVSDANRKAAVEAAGFDYGRWQSIIVRQVGKRGPKTKRQAYAAFWLGYNGWGSGVKYEDAILAALEAELTSHVSGERFAVNSHKSDGRVHSRRDAGESKLVVPSSVQRLQNFARYVWSVIDRKISQGVLADLRSLERGPKFLALPGQMMGDLFGAIGLTFLLVLAFSPILFLPRLFPRIRSFPFDLDYSLSVITLLSVPVVAFLVCSCLLKYARLDLRVVAPILVCLVGASYAGVYFYGNSKYEAETAFYEDVKSRVEYWDVSGDYGAANAAGCIDIATQEGGNQQLVSQCKPDGVAMRITADSRSRTGVASYPSNSAALSGDFYVETLYRPVGASLQACTLSWSPAGKNEVNYLRLYPISTGPEAGFGATVESFDSIRDFHRKYAIRSEVLPYVENPAFFEPEYVGGDAWTMLGVYRQDDEYSIFVDRRLVAKYKTPNVIESVTPRLTTISGNAQTGGKATCDYRYLRVYAR
jgi:hypothetical protein